MSLESPQGWNTDAVGTSSKVPVMNKSNSFTKNSACMISVRPLEDLSTAEQEKPLGTLWDQHPAWQNVHSCYH